MDRFASKTVSIGRLRCTAICDKIFDCPLGLLGAEAQRAEWLRALDLAEPAVIPLPVNTLLVEAANRLILIDVGEGVRPNRDPSDNGHLIDELGSLGVRPTEVDLVVITHPDADHLAGAVAVNGEGLATPVFTDA